jgi:hypothetical protein
MDTILSFPNPFTQGQWTESFQRWPKTLQESLHRATLFRQCKDFIKYNPDTAKQITDDLETIHKSQQDIEPLLRDSTTIESEGYGQVCFQGNPWSLLNSIPFALVCLSIFKSYIVPAFSIFLPILSCILPYLLLKTFYNIPISFTDYTAILWRMWNGQALPRTPQELLQAPLPQEDVDITQKIKQLVQNGWTLFTIGQAMWQPIQQAKHFIRLDNDCSKKGDIILSVINVSTKIVQKAKGFLPGWLENWIQQCPTTSRQAFAFILENRYWLTHLLRSLGRFEVLWTLANREDTVPVEFIKSKEPILLLKEFGDPSISLSKRVLSSVRLGGSGEVSHAIVTGPNRGGKSSTMRGIACNVRLAHAFGAAFAKRAQMTHFTWIADGLRLADAPGEQSMFEKEVGFAAGILQKIKQDPEAQGLVLYDEIFHSTNPPDATRASQLFCSSLWTSRSCLSFISTHVYSLAHQAPVEYVKKLCLGTWVNAKGDYTFSYKLHRGVCEVSSVDLLLKQFGFPCGKSESRKPASDS